MLSILSQIMRRHRWAIARSKSDGHTVTVLKDGNVLIAGGDSSQAALYVPASGNFVAKGTMSVYRVEHTSTLLRDGRVLLAEGSGAASTSAELYQP